MVVEKQTRCDKAHGADPNNHIASSSNASRLTWQTKNPPFPIFQTIENPYQIFGITACIPPTPQTEVYSFQPLASFTIVESVLHTQYIVRDGRTVNVVALCWLTTLPFSDVAFSFHHTPFFPRLFIEWDKTKHYMSFIVSAVGLATHRPSHICRPTSQLIGSLIQINGGHAYRNSQPTTEMDERFGFFLGGLNPDTSIEGIFANGRLTTRRPGGLLGIDIAGRSSDSGMMPCDSRNSGKRLEY